MTARTGLFTGNIRGNFQCPFLRQRVYFHCSTTKGSGFNLNVTDHLRASRAGSRVQSLLPRTAPSCADAAVAASADPSSLARWGWRPDESILGYCQLRLRCFDDTVLVFPASMDARCTERAYAYCLRRQRRLEPNDMYTHEKCMQRK